MFRRSNRIADAIRNSDLSRSVSRRELDVVEQRGTEVRLPAGLQIITENSPARECLLVVDGALDVTRGGVHVARLGPGDFVGEMALLNRQLRSATVTVAEPTVAFAFSRRDFASVLAACPGVASHVHSLVAGRTMRAAA